MPHEFLLERRTLLGSIAALLGVVAVPVDALAGPGSKARRFLSPSQFGTLSAVADTLLPATDTPGALAADVPARLDALLANWASAATREQVIGALDRIQAAALALRNQGFSGLSAADREAMLRAHDAAALKPVAPPTAAPKFSGFAPTVHVADTGYYRIKALVIDLYYFSQPATSSELVYEHVPGAWQPSVKLTADSRPHLGVSFL
ncbi:MAG: hypothetical protein RLZZ200_1551 [Pseudomonadota bacterium]|jgi:hypothetical protein